jgi:hypothetical protein
MSLITVLLLLFNGWKGWEMVYQYRPSPPPDRCAAVTSAFNARPRSAPVARKAHSGNLSALRPGAPNSSRIIRNSAARWGLAGVALSNPFCNQRKCCGGSWMSSGEPGRDGIEARHEIEALLPWYAAGTLSRSDADRVERALAGDSELARCYDRIREELVETIYLNETLGAPSDLVAEKLFAAIDAEETRAPRRRLQRLSRTSVTASP